VRRERRDAPVRALVRARYGDPPFRLFARRVELDEYAERRVGFRTVSVEEVGEFGARERLDRV
jgi:hypothetical protein